MFKVSTGKKEVLLITLPSLLFGIIFAINNLSIIPYLAENTTVTPYIIAQIVNTVLLFIPIFLVGLVYLKAEIYELKWTAIKERVHIRKVTIKELGIVILSLVVSITAVAAIVFILQMLPLPEGFKTLDSISPIELRPFSGTEFYFLLALPVVFFFNYAGEELLWRGVLFQRQTVIFHRYAWIVNGLLHMVFHLYMGKLALLMAPIFLAISYTYCKTKNLSAVIIMHAILGVPTDLLLIFGFVI